MKKGIRVLFIIFFMVILLVPGVFSDKEGGKIAPGENRYLAAAPRLGLYEGFGTAMEEWINDNAAGRSLLKGWYEALDINVLKSKRDKAHYYAGEWVYNLNDDTISYLRHSNLMSAEELEQLKTKYKSFEDHLGQRGIPLCGVVFPSKMEIYPEHMETYILKANEMSQIENLDKNMAADPQFHMSVAYDELMQAKQAGKQVYPKAYDGIHWNSQGAFIGYQMLMRQVNEVYPGIRMYGENEFDKTPVQKEIVYNLKTYVDEDIEYTFKEGAKAELDMTWFDDMEGIEMNDPWRSYRYYRNQDGSLPKLLIAGDSFVWMALLPHISQSFSETVFINNWDAGKLLPIIDRFGPDVVCIAGLPGTFASVVSTVEQTIPKASE